MPRANLKGQSEIEFLRQAVRTTFEQHANRTLVANTNKGNYVRLAEEISSIATAKAKGSRLERMDLTVSDGQVRSLFIESNKDFLDYFVEACYLYSQGVGRDDFFNQAENVALLQSWEQDKTAKLLPNETLVLNGEWENLKAEKQALENQVGNLTQKTKRLMLAAGLALVGLSALFFYQNHQKTKELERLSVWSGNRGNIEKSVLIKHLDFLKPNSGFLTVVDTIIQSLTTPSVFATEDALPIVHFKTIKASSGYKKYGNFFYPDQISIIPFHGFDLMRLDTAKAKTRGMASYLYKLYSQIALQNDETYVSKHILAQIMALDKTAFDVDLIYVGYKKDIQIADSDDFMLRYPPYRLDEANLQDYVMINRQWWKEAIYKTGINWQQTFNGQMHACGISKPYPTVRANAPNQRTFWVEIDVPTDSAKMVLAIDLVLKEM